MKGLKITVWSINLILIVLLVSRVIIIDNDKSPLAYIVGYTFLTTLNIIIWIILLLLKAEFSKQFKLLIIGLLILFLPLLFLVILI